MDPSPTVGIAYFICIFLYLRIFCFVHSPHYRLDILLPDLDGSEISSQLRQDPRFKEIPVVFLTGMLTEEEVGAQGNLVGGRPFLAKPVRPQQVLECIRSVLGELL